MKDTQKAANDTKMSRARYSELKQMLAERRREIQAEVQGKMRGVREEGTWGGKMNEVLDAVESAEADIQEDLEFALVQMKSETLNKINDALGASRAGRLRQLLRLRRRDCGEASAGAAVRGSLQGLRRGQGERGAARAASRCAARHLGACSSTCKHPASQFPGAPPVAEPNPPSPAQLPISNPGSFGQRGSA
jgi:RNA polymerase-binding transcription factor DksA